MRSEIANGGEVVLPDGRKVSKLALLKYFGTK
jgi:hypothetical protein